MSESDAVPASPVKVKSPKKKSPKAKAVVAHPLYSKMVIMAVEALEERGGSSKKAILKYIMKNFDVTNAENKVNSRVKVALRAAVDNNKLTVKEAKGRGANAKGMTGSFKLVQKKTKADKPKKPKVKAAAKKAKSPKKTTTPKKSPKAKKVAKSPKKATKSPKKATKSPKKATKSPKKGRGRPKKSATWAVGLRLFTCCISSSWGGLGPAGGG